MKMDYSICINCKKKLKGDFVALNGGSMKKTKTGAVMEENHIGFLSINNHFDSKKNYRSLSIIDESPNGQFEFYACSHKCLADFILNKIMSLYKLDTALKFKKIEIAPEVKLKKIDLKVLKYTLKLLGHPEALITDESIVGDFLFAFDEKMRLKLKKLSEIFGFEIKSSDYIWQIAKKFKRSYRPTES
jgi:hypothetical protein